MADREGDREWTERLVQVRARTLIEALERVKSRGRGVQQQNRPLGRVGVIPPNWVGGHNNNDERVMCSRQEMSQGRGGIYNQMEQQPRGLSLCNRRGRGQGLVINFPILKCISQHPTEGRGRGRALAPPSPTP